jgi:predicted N-acetyltransferase YhbS
VAFTAAALMLDVLEVSHQISEERIGLALMAAGIATTRAAAIAGSGYLYTTARRPRNSRLFELRGNGNTFV